jgi:lipoate-protein ligase A
VRWRLLQTPPLDGPFNMALDHALMARARQGGEAVLRVYEWSAPVLSLGRNQRARGIYISDELARRDIAVVRRPTGGRALLHHREVTYSLTAPANAGETLGVMYRRMNALLLEALSALGVPGVLARPATRARPPTAMPCFAEPSGGEIVVDGQKLVGSAQWRDDGALLQHGSILVENDQVTLLSLMCEPAAMPPRPATLREILGRVPDASEVARALFAAVRRMEDPDASSMGHDEYAALDTSRYLDIYRDPEWTWRR